VRGGFSFPCAISFALFFLPKCCDAPPVYFCKE
jgi:hypothetical protein